MRARILAVVVALFALGSTVRIAWAHCDTTRGPVVSDARAALAAGDVSLVLHWVRAEDEPAIREAFRHAIAVRALGPEAMELADRFFFETLVRIHRASEGAPYTGLVDREPEPIIAAVDRALERGSADEVEAELVAAVKTGLAERFAAARAAHFRRGDVVAGRAWVEAYVKLTHWVEGVAASAEGAGGEHHAAAHAPEHSVAAGATSGGPLSFDAGRAVPWIAAALLAIAALLEGAFLFRRRRLAH